ncbi:MAG: TolC family protein [Phycisphaerae bacterium]
MSKALLCIIVILIAGCKAPETSPLRALTDEKQIVSEPLPVVNADPGQNNKIIEEPQGTLTLEKALALTLLKNPTLKAYSYDIRAAEARTLQAGLGPNPELEVEAENFAGSGSTGGFDSAETTISISQLIEVGNKAQKREKVASLESRMSRQDYEMKRIQTLSDVRTAFIELLAAQERAALLSELVSVSQQALSIVEQRVEAGTDSPLEKTRAAVGVSAAKIEQKQATGELTKAKIALASFWGCEQPAFTKVEGSLDTSAEIPDIELLQQQLLNSPRLKLIAAEIAVNRATTELEKAKAKPDVSIAGGYRRFNDTDESAFVFGVSIPLPISNRNQGGRMEAAARLSGSMERQRAVHIKAMNRLQEIYADLSNSISRVNEFKATVLPGAEEIFEASQEAYRQGKVNYLNVLDARKIHFESQNAYLDAVVSCRKSIIALEELTGQDINIQSNQE